MLQSYLDECRKVSALLRCFAPAIFVRVGVLVIDYKLLLWTFDEFAEVLALLYAAFQSPRYFLYIFVYKC